MLLTCQSLTIDLEKTGKHLIQMSLLNWVMLLELSAGKMLYVSLIRDMGILKICLLIYEIGDYYCIIVKMTSLF